MLGTASATDSTARSHGNLNDVRYSNVAKTNATANADIRIVSTLWRLGDYGNVVLTDASGVAPRVSVQLPPHEPLFGAVQYEESSLNVSKMTGV